MRLDLKLTGRGRREGGGRVQSAIGGEALVTGRRLGSPTNDLHKDSSAEKHFQPQRQRGCRTLPLHISNLPMWRTHSPITITTFTTTSSTLPPPITITTFTTTSSTLPPIDAALLPRWCRVGAALMPRWCRVGAVNLKINDVCQFMTEFLNCNKIVMISISFCFLNCWY